jgi:hypothetical protein
MAGGRFRIGAGVFPWRKREAAYLHFQIGKPVGERLFQWSLGFLWVAAAAVVVGATLWI